MKRKIKMWALRLTVTLVFISCLLIALILNPCLTYANKATHNGFTIYYSTTLDSEIYSHLDQAEQLIKSSEIYNSNLKIDICLNDGSVYPSIIKFFLGDAFGYGFYNKVVLNGQLNCADNYVELNGYKWNLTQLLAHEMTHCYQINKFGIFHSKPFADIPNWKWEGFAEYVSRQGLDQKDLLPNIHRYVQSDENLWEITFKDGTVTSRQYFLYWILVKYCLEVKQLSYSQLLNDQRTEESLLTEMLNWYQQQEERELL
jgi:hypothetical protein